MNILITGVSNKKSIAYNVAKKLPHAQLFFAVQHEDQKTFVNKEFPNAFCHLLDVESSDSIEDLSSELQKRNILLNGFLHSIAFANFTANTPFEATSWDHFSQAVRISCFSLAELSHKLKPILALGASVVTLSISTTRATSYGYMGPIKAMLNSFVDYLAKSFSHEGVRFNAIGAGPLKTSASAGIPGYVENYLFAEQLTLRKKNLSTEEVANTAAFLLSPASSGINATVLTVDAGMSVNYFDEKVVERFNALS
jgi:enoyl-[acyl-carrier protein] reductase I